MKHKKSLLTLVIHLFALYSFAQISTVQFTENTGAISNPERGFYRHADSHSADIPVDTPGNNYKLLTQTQLNGYKNDGNSLILRLFYLHEFAGSDNISQTYLNNMASDFQTLRTAGMKAIVRFAYTNVQADKDKGVTSSRIQNHLEDLKAVMTTYQDVITVVQAGFIGTWGEWYYTDNFGDQGIISNADWIERNNIVSALLENVPPSIMVELRAPQYKTRYLQTVNESLSALNESEAYNPSLAKARLGYHNDCFLSSPDDSVKIITIPKTLITNLASTITLGYRALKNFVPANLAQLPISTNPMISYALGSSAANNGVIDWENTPNITFPFGFIKELKVADDANNLYVRVVESGYLDMDTYELFINKDNNTTTGWIDAAAWTNSGADILLQGEILYSYAGTGNGWGWAPTGTGTTVVHSFGDAWDDVGTFLNEAEIEYVEADSRFLAVGGESCFPNNQNQCANSLNRMQEHHYTYMNNDFNPDVIADWKAQGCFDEMSKKLGYRLKLTESRIQTAVNAGRNLSVSLDVTNDGFAAPYKARSLQLVLTNTNNSQEYKIDFMSGAADIRFWQSGTLTINEDLHIPTNIPVGSYTLALNLPDASTALNTNPNFSIQLANQGIWDATSGYNSLNTTINILAPTTPSTPTIIVDGAASDWVDVDILGLGGNSIQTIKSYDDADNLYFLATGTFGNGYQVFIDADGKSYTGYNGGALGADYKVENGKIYRHEFAESWVELSATFEIAHNGAVTEVKIPKTILYGLDESVAVGYNDLQNGTLLAKLPVSGNLHGYVLNFPLTVPRPTINIVADGNSSDWAFVNAISNAEGDLQLLKAFDDQSNLYFLVKGSIADYQVFINTDNDASTGLVDNSIWLGMGADYAIIGGLLYKHDPTSANGVNGWAWINPAAITSQISSANDTHEIVISKTILNSFPVGILINIGYRKLINNAQTAKIPAIGGMAIYAIESPYIADLQSLTVSDDVNKIHLTILGGKINPMYRAYLDTDNNPNTGNNDGNWTTMGADYLIENGSLFLYDAASSGWTFVTSNIQITDDLTLATKTRNISIGKTDLPTFVVGNTINVGYMNLTSGFAVDGKLPASGGLMPYIIQNNYVPDLLSITVSDDINNIKIVVKGSNIVSNYELLINADNQATTGYADGTWTTMGADYMLQNNLFYQHNQPNSAWGWTPVSATITVTDSILSNTLSQRTMLIPKSAFTQLNNSISLGYRSVVNGTTAAKLPEGGMLDYVITPVAQAIGETGKITTTQANEYEWKTITLSRSYNNPVIIFSPLSYNDSDPGAIRVKNVASNSFQYQIDEWDYLDEEHDQETFFYLVVESGVYELDGGVTIEAGKSNVDDHWSEITINEAFTNTPLVFAQTLTYNDDEAVTTRIKWIDSQGFQLKVQAEEGNAGQGHDFETVGWLAMTAGSGNAGRVYEIDGTNREYDHIFYEIYFSNTYTNPIVLANMQTTYGGNTAALRYENLLSDEISIKVEEEKSADYEVWHTNEEIGFAVFEGSGSILGTPVQVENEQSTGSSNSRVAGVSTEEVISKKIGSEMLVYPNPLQNGSSLKITAASELGFEIIQIYNSTGKLIFNNKNISDSEIIDTSEWASGLHIIKLIKNTGEYRQYKVINLR